jgi:hypothetical protein
MPTARTYWLATITIPEYPAVAQGFDYSESRQVCQRLPSPTRHSEAAIYSVVTCYRMEAPNLFS